MNVGCYKILVARVAKTSLFKQIRVFSNFFVLSNLLKTANEYENFTGVESLGTAPKFELGMKKIIIRYLFSRPPNNVP